MELSVVSEYKTEDSVQVAWFEDPDACVEYQLTWVPGSLSFRPRICVYQANDVRELPAGVDPVDLLIEMDTALERGGYR